MTSQIDVHADPNFTACLDYGFVGLIDVMGDDAAIARAARLSYGAGTHTVRENRGLIRYLMRHRHTSPFEMAEVKLHIKCPIFVMRQIGRHRTASLNEYSGRYSEMPDEIYLPAPERIQRQSTANKQGSGGEYPHLIPIILRAIFAKSYEISYAAYRKFVMLDMARETARLVMPVATYTEVIWKQDLHNIFHLLELRLDPHAQWETRVFAEAIYNLIQPKFPLAFEAFEDYVRQARTLSRMERLLLRDTFTACRARIYAANTDRDVIARTYGMTKREVNDFYEQVLGYDGIG